MSLCGEDAVRLLAPEEKRRLEIEMAAVLTSGRLDPVQVVFHALRFGLVDGPAIPDAGEVWRKPE
jgi:hypothetical protein